VWLLLSVSDLLAFDTFQCSCWTKEAFRRNIAPPYEGYRETVRLSESLGSAYYNVWFLQPRLSHFESFSVQFKRQITYIRTYAHACTHTIIHTHSHTYTYMHALYYNFFLHKYTNIHIGIHKYIQFFSMVQEPNLGQVLLITEASRPHSVTHRFDMTRLEEWSARHRDLYIYKRHVHTPYGIRTHNLSKWAAVDPRLRLCGHWDRLNKYIHTYEYIHTYLLTYFTCIRYIHNIFYIRTKTHTVAREVQISFASWYGRSKYLCDLRLELASCHQSGV
jgi:hypothetical protein